MTWDEDFQPETPLKLRYVLMIAAGVAGIGSLSASHSMNLCRQQEHTRALMIQAQTLSAGEDRVWSDNEKRKFLDSFRMNNVIIQQGQNIYFRRRELDSDSLDVVLGYNLENNGSLLIGSSAKSGDVIGTLDSKSLQNYIDSYNSQYGNR